MKKQRYPRLLALSLALLLLCGCLPVGEVDKSKTYVTVTDDGGTTEDVPRSPARVAVLFSSLADLWTLAGGEVAITVGETVERGIVPEGVLLVDAGAGKTVNTELLLSAGADLIIGSADVAAHVECVALARRVGIPAVLFRVESFDDYLRVLGVMTALTGDTAAYETYGLALQTRIDALLNAERPNDAPRVLFLRAGSSARSTKAKNADGHFAAAMLDELGAMNIADEAPILIDTLSIEAILASDPDYILITTMGDEAAARAYIETLLDEPTWQSLSAVQEGNVHILPKELFQYKPCAAWYEAYEYLSELINETNE
ncbi:MAG: ABC transporter substrate-binding protein [Clostridia bacterium]|nr:ABC transporter substrate-binding protein [Clostridia bacterium]